MTDLELAFEVNSRGYAVISQPVPADPFDAHRAIAHTLGLPAAYTPLLYRDAEVREIAGQTSPYNMIPRDVDQVKPWSEGSAQKFHVDGLLEPLGGVKTTILHCLSQAHSGGETELFFACDAFADLATMDESAANSLLAPTALTRYANLGTLAESRLRATGPAFGWISGELCTRFADGPTEIWNESDPLLRKALAYMRGPAREKHCTKVRLAPGEMLIFRNDRLAHRGCAYLNGTQPRRLTRSMYDSAPQPLPDGDPQR
jgi:hypothetical protein